MSQWELVHCIHRALPSSFCSHIPQEILEAREAIEKSGDVSLPGAERLRYLQFAFFAPGRDPHVWLKVWHPESEKAENDAAAPRKFAVVLKAALGDRVTVVVIPNAGHALVPEHPEAMANAVSHVCAHAPLINHPWMRMIDGPVSEAADFQQTAHPSANPEEWSAQLLKAWPSVFE